MLHGDNMPGGIGVVGDGAVVFEAIAAIAQVAEWTTDPLQNNRNPLWDFGVVSPVLIEATCHHSLGDNIAKRHSLLTPLLLLGLFKTFFFAAMRPASAASRETGSQYAN